MSYRDDILARIEVLEARVAALEESAPASPTEDETWERMAGLWPRKRLERFVGPRTCGHCWHWDHTNQKWGKTLDHEHCDFDDDKLYAKCLVKPRLSTHAMSGERCQQFYPAKRFWGRVHPRVGERKP